MANRDNPRNNNSNRDSRGKGRGQGRRGGGGGKRQRRDNDSRGKNSNAEQGSEAIGELVFVGGDEALTASLDARPFPLDWGFTNPIALLSDGVYFKHGAGLATLTRGTELDGAVLYALWDDDKQNYRVGRDRWVQLGRHAAFLVPNHGDSGPPWVPMTAEIEVSGDELETGLLSSWSDRIHCVKFSGQLKRKKGVLKVRSTELLADEHDEADTALLDTLRWLRDNPEDQSAAAVLARTLLVKQGHGLQRAGITLMHSSADASRELLEQLLPAFAPDVASVLGAVWRLWHAEGDSTRQVVELAESLRDLRKPNSPLQSSANLAMLTTWLSGIFGSRPDRQLQRPARSLFAILRYLRQVNGRTDLFGHVDSDAPKFPLARSESNAVLSELSSFPDDETMFERLVRAMAVGESASEFRRPTLDHIRPFRICVPRVLEYPVAAQTLLSRYDGVLTSWSFRGRELDFDNVNPRHLAANLILEASTTASVRGLARVLGSGRNASAPLLEALSSESRNQGAVHEHISALASLPELSTEDLVDQAEKASRAGKAYENRLLDALAPHEYLVARCDQSQEEAGYSPVAPEWGDNVEYPVRRQFMFWRAFCRSIYRPAHDVYAGFFNDWVPALNTLPVRLEIEALALMRNWIRLGDASVEALQAHRDALVDRLDVLLAELPESGRWDERHSSLFGVLAVLDRDAWIRRMEHLLTIDAWDFRDAHRMLHGVRLAGWAGDLIDLPIFRLLHTRLIDGAGPHATLARVEWLRRALDRSARHGAAIWLLRNDDYAQFVESDSFRALFRDRGLGAIEKPDEVVIDVLEAAAHSVDPDQVDLVMYRLDRNTSWPVEEKYRLLNDADRPAATASWLLTQETTTTDMALETLNKLIEQSDGSAEAALLAARIVHHVQLRGATVEDSIIDHVAEIARAHRPQHELPSAGAARFDALRLIGRAPEDSESDSIVRAIRFFVATKEDACLAYVADRVGQAWSTYVGDVATVAADAAKARELAQKLDAATLPGALDGVADELEKLSPKSRIAKSLLRAVSGPPTMERINIAAINAALASGVADGVVEALESLPDDADAPTDETVGDEDGAQEQPDVSEESGDETDGSGDSAPAGMGDEPTVHERIRERVLERSIAAARSALIDGFRTAQLLAGVSAENDEPSAQSFRAQQPITLSVRHGIYRIADALMRAKEFKVDEGRRLLSSDFVDTRTRLDPENFAQLLRILIALADETEHRLVLKIDRRSLELVFHELDDAHEPEAGAHDTDNADSTEDDSNDEEGADGEDVADTEKDADSTEGEPDLLRDALKALNNKGNVSPGGKAALLAVTAKELAVRNTSMKLSAKTRSKHPIVSIAIRTWR